MTLASEIHFEPLEEEHVKAIYDRQNEETVREYAAFFEKDPPWKLLSLEEVKKEVESVQKKDRGVMHAICKDEVMVGFVRWSASWDPWQPFLNTFVFPEYRRKGYGTLATEKMMARTFDESVAGVLEAFVLSHNEGGIAFAKKMGFKEQGRVRRLGIFEGRFYHGVQMDILREEYDERRGALG